MKANSRAVLLTMGIAAIVIAVILTLYENYTYIVFIGIFLLFLLIIYLASSVKS